MLNNDSWYYCIDLSVTLEYFMCNIYDAQIKYIFNPIYICMLLSKYKP
jgi:hypothetical protein